MNSRSDVSIRRNLPNILTLSRVVSIPLIILTFYVPFKFARWLATVLFIYACLTDFFDGFLARRWNFISSFGQFLDPIADKLLVCSVLMMLVGKDIIPGISVLAAIVILCREILVSGLREFLAELHCNMPVNWLAKWKTGIQMVAIGALLMGDAGPWVPAVIWKSMGLGCLWIAAILTLYTGFDYLKAASQQLGPFWHKDGREGG